MAESSWPSPSSMAESSESDWESFIFVGVLLGKKKPCRTCTVKETNDWANRSWKEKEDFEP